MLLVRLEDFKFLIDTQTNYEFSYKGINYNLTYGKDKKGDYIAFGERFFQKKYYSYKELLNDARIENSFFREMIEEL